MDPRRRDQETVPGRCKKRSRAPEHNAPARHFGPGETQTQLTYAEEQKNRQQGVGKVIEIDIGAESKIVEGIPTKADREREQEIETEEKELAE